MCLLLLKRRKMRVAFVINLYCNINPLEIYCFVFDYRMTPTWSLVSGGGWAGNHRRNREGNLKSKHRARDGEEKGRLVAIGSRWERGAENGRKTAGGKVAKTNMQQNARVFETKLKFHHSGEQHCYIRPSQHSCLWAKANNSWAQIGRLINGNLFPSETIT